MNHQILQKQTEKFATTNKTNTFKVSKLETLELHFQLYFENREKKTLKSMISRVNTNNSYKSVPKIREKEKVWYIIFCLVSEKNEKEKSNEMKIHTGVEMRNVKRN